MDAREAGFCTILASFASIMQVQHRKSEFGEILNTFRRTPNGVQPGAAVAYHTAIFADSDKSFGLPDVGMKNSESAHASIPV